MGETGENVAERYGVSREEQDAFALQSQRRWAAADADGRFADELVPVGDVVRDEHPRPDTDEEKLAALKPAFREGGTVTAGNSSGINDGAAALVIASEERARELGAEPLGAFVGSAVAGVDPRVMGIGPVPAVQKLLGRAGVEVGELDLVELNEAFASQSLVVIRELGLDPERVNVNGGAIALGHPLGMSGARLVVTLLHELRRRGGRYGLATLCVGVGQGQAALFQRELIRSSAISSWGCGSAGMTTICRLLLRAGGARPARRGRGAARPGRAGRGRRRARRELERRSVARRAGAGARRERPQARRRAARLRRGGPARLRDRAALARRGAVPAGGRDPRRGAAGQRRRCASAMRAGSRRPRSRPSSSSRRCSTRPPSCGG